MCQSVLLCQEQGAAQPGILHLRSVLNHLQRGEYQLSSEHRHDISSHHRSVVTHHCGATTLLSDMQAMFDNVSAMIFSDIVAFKILASKTVSEGFADKYTNFSVV